MEVRKVSFFSLHFGVGTWHLASHSAWPLVLVLPAWLALGSCLLPSVAHLGIATLQLYALRPDNNVEFTFLSLHRLACDLALLHCARGESAPVGDGAYEGRDGVHASGYFMISDDVPLWDQVVR